MSLTTELHFTIITLGVQAQQGYSSCLSRLNSKFNRSTNNTTYLTHNKGVKNCGIFSETAPLQSQSPSSIVLLDYVSLPFSLPTDKWQRHAEGLHFSAFYKCMCV